MTGFARTTSTRPDSYSDFTVRIGERRPDDVAYPVSGHFRPGDRRPDGTFELPRAGFGPQLDAALEAMEKGDLGADAAREFGTELFHALLRGDLAQVYEAGFGSDAPGRLRLIVDPAELKRIPWELLYDDRRRQFLAVRGPVVRGISGGDADPAAPLKASLPLRVLIVDAFPVGTERLESDLEAEGIAHALADLGSDAEVVPLPRVTLPRLQDELRSAKHDPDRGPFHILHFTGHGDVDRNGDTVLLLERDEYHQRDEVTPTDLLAHIGEYDLKLVFLNACRSSAISSLEAAEAFGPALVRSGIPAVIGMQASVTDGSATLFATDFYAAIADNRPVDAALTDARRLRRTGDEDAMAEFGIPVCYLRSEDGRILDFPPRIPWWRTWRGALSIATALAILVIAVVLARDWVQAEPKMNLLDFNVAVAEFTAIVAGGSAVDEDLPADLSEKVHESIAAELAQLDIDVAVWGPDETGAITSASRESRAATAARRADEINADIVVYGTVALDGGVAIVQPEFYLTDRKLLGAPELTGQYELGAEDPFNVNNAVAVTRARESIAHRAEALGTFIEGLAHFALPDYESAMVKFEVAAEHPGWTEVGGKEILFLFVGNTAARLGDFGAARANYDAALDANDGYARARIGKADMLFQEARDGCLPAPDGHADQGGLDAAADEFDVALEAEFRPALADVEEKVAFGLGRVYACQAIAGFPAGDAAAAFDQVINAYEGGNDRLRELAWESHAGLALLHASVPPQDFSAAIAEYQRAIDLATDPDRRAIFLGDQAWSYIQLGDRETALVIYDRALTQATDMQIRIRLETERSSLQDELATKG